MRRWEEELGPELDARGILRVAICADTPEEIRAARARHGFRGILLADPDLAVTHRYRLRNEINLTPKGVAPMPVPTTILVDEAGTVRWIDRAEDYQIRSHPDRVRAALREAFGSVPPEAPPPSRRGQ